ncbi:MAG: 3-deoxy-7-phosphoheptulonate synthase [Clostridiales bacterium]|nr:3-deoxy-7-phosphoheptulonate synthase [Clostridiales bacterium]
MIIIIRADAQAEKRAELTDWVRGLGLDVHLSEGADTTVMGLVGDTSRVDIDILKALDIVKDVLRVSEPYKKANRKFHPADSVVGAGGCLAGGGKFALIAGPCSVESEAQIVSVAKKVKAAGAGLLRGGAYKPRSSPYAFQGLKEEGLRLLLLAKKETGLPVVSEITAVTQLPLFGGVDIIQVGARNMQNFELLKELGRTDKPILLKRGLSSTLEELLMSAEYIMAGGNERIILCERGIRTFEPATRNTLDISAVPWLKERTHLPVIVDPSHASGISRLVPPLSLAAAAAGADGLIIEVHEDPARALCDGPQCIKPDELLELVAKLDTVLTLTGKARA